MNQESIFVSITRELFSGKDRVSGLVGTKHRQTYGEAREDLLRDILRRHLPRSIEVSKGIVSTDAGVSGQIDILLHHADCPVLSRESNFVILTPSATVGIIEVKSTLHRSRSLSELKRLGDLAELVRNHNPGRECFVGLFAFSDGRVRLETVAGQLNCAAGGRRHRIIPCVSIGTSGFIQYHRFAPERPSELLHSWRTYQTPEIGPGAFIAHVIHTVCRKTDPFGMGSVDFPRPLLEPYRELDVQFQSMETEV